MKQSLQEAMNVAFEKKFIEKHQVIGVGVSGGKDSMALLHLLNQNKEKFEFEIVAINIDHMIRENSASDSEFVIDYCKKNNIKTHQFKVNAKKYSQENKMSLELAARQLRYGVFEALIKKGIVNKIALAHHQNDQAETILMNLFRGTGTSGIQGMDYQREDGFIRPFLNISKTQIEEYISQHEIPFVVDQTNEEDTYNRNFVRNQIIPLILQRWPSALQSITNFAQIVAEDDEYISSHVLTDAVLFDDKLAKIPSSYFLQDRALVSRMIFEVLKKIGVTKDFERKHVEMLIAFSKNEKTGAKLDFPCELKAIKEYDYVTLVNHQKEKITLQLPFKIGKIDFAGQLFRVSKIAKEDFEKTPTNLMLDLDKVPKDAVWRVKQEGDVFCKFGGGTKKLKSYLTDKKIPSRLRETLPILAKDNQVFAILGVEIADSVKVDETTKNCAVIAKI